MLYHVVAIADNRVIGKDNKLPWHFPADLKFFKELTTGSTVIMGRKTFESIGRPLPNRENLVLSRSHNPGPEKGGNFFNSVEAALKQVKTQNAYIIGGAELYKQTMGSVDGIYLTLIHAEYEGDAFYPEIPSSFRVVSRKTLQENPKIEVLFYENTKK